ncbi:GNAT family N-acetyltransferase [Nocardioides donggukensis]|uniref:GNAT family N-acetyltransferase n=1 Tax=Nocardioides donggukensis TaxID=2774019 RepID=A0A927PZM8_9ACTN|nr:GNAT family N-acetyltransferase [Nocardioides donggukensis]MBD8870478.1 GNAT family N-acetyltransferase [Nocardioides donggukensis]
MSTYTTDVASTEAQVESWRSWWELLPIGDVDAELDYFLTVAGTDTSVVSPYALRVRAGDLPPALVAARLVDERFRPGVAGARFGSVRARALVVAFDGVVGAETPELRAAVTDALDDVLASGTADLVVLQKVATDSPWFTHVTAGGGRRRGTLVRAVQPRWFTDLPDSWEQLLAARSSKSRRQIRYDDNKLRRAYGDRLTLRPLHDPEHAERLLPDLRTVAAVSYQRGLGVSLVDGPVQEALLTRAQERGRLRVWMLYIDDAPVAFWWGIVHGGVLTIGSPGFVPEHAKDRVGYYTLRRMLEAAADDPHITRIDYGPGDADYKQRFASSSVPVADVLLFARRPRPGAVRALLWAEDRILRAGRAAAERGGRAAELRRWWRARMVATRGGGPGAA